MAAEQLQPRQKNIHICFGLRFFHNGLLVYIEQSSDFAPKHANLPSFMSKNLALVLGHINAGRKVRLYTDVFGAWLVEVPTGWLGRKVKVELEKNEIDQVKDALRSRRGGASATTR